MPLSTLAFDIVVFYEASQIRVADAVGAMGRARSAVVVGDSKQMPPTSFGEPTDETAAIEALLVEPDQERILTEVDQAGIKQLDLTWHYRSKDESLIAFSNERYYNDRLSSFPSPAAEVDKLGRRTEGVSLVRVQGSFVRSSGPDRGTNRVEAEAIVADIQRRFAESPHVTPSVGVVTFNMPQRTLVDTMLRDLEDPRITEALERKDGEGLFVKNLENVQGDERDVVLFSTAFSKNAKGVLPLNFGPLNNRGGERRLNVAITRARAQVVIYSSFDPADLRVDATGSQGIKDLAAYLTMAAGRSAGIEPAARNPVRDRHRDQIASALRQAGLEVSTDVGLSDFKIDLALAPAGSDSPVVAVLLDGEGWAARRTVGDRDGLPVAVLENLMGWELVERVWLPEWLADPDEVVERLVAAVGLAAEEAARPPVEQRIEPADAAAPELVSTAPSSPSFRSMSSPTPSPAAGYALTGSTSFAPWKERSIGSRQYLDALPSKLATDKVRAAILEVVARRRS